MNRHPTANGRAALRKKIQRDFRSFADPDAITAPPDPDSPAGKKAASDVQYYYVRRAASKKGKL
jgi:hypothetical protein